MPAIFSAQDFARALAGATGGALGGGAAGALVGAVRAPEGESRRQHAVQGARSGALGGAVLGGASMAVPTVMANLLGARADQMSAERQAAQALGYQDPDFDRAAEALAALRDRLLEMIPPGALDAARAGAVGAAGARAATEARRLAVERLRQLMPQKGHGSVAPEGRVPYGGVNGAAKTGMVSTTSAPEDSPHDQRARRLAELLKRAVPTTSAGGSTAPTPPRGTP